MDYLSDDEKRLLLTALSKEKKLCKELYPELVPTVESLENKFYYDRMFRVIRNDVVDEFLRTANNNRDLPLTKVGDIVKGWCRE